MNESPLLGLLLLAPVIIVALYAAYKIWAGVTGRTAAAQQRKRDQLIETQMRLGMRDAEAMQRAADKIANEEK
jgi:hypothetical protein